MSTAESEYEVAKAALTAAREHVSRAARSLAEVDRRGPTDPTWRAAKAELDAWIAHRERCERGYDEASARLIAWQNDQWLAAHPGQTLPPGGY